MTIFLILVFLGMLFMLAIICENVADWFATQRSFYLFFIGLLYITVWTTPTFYLGWVIFKRLTH